MTPDAPLFSNEKEIIFTRHLGEANRRPSPLSTPFPLMTKRKCRSAEVHQASFGTRPTMWGMSLTYPTPPMSHSHISRLQVDFPNRMRTQNKDRTPRSKGEKKCLSSGNSLPQHASQSFVFYLARNQGCSCCREHSVGVSGSRSGPSMSECTSNHV